MRILFVSDDLDDLRIGAVQAVHRLAERLRHLGHECDLLFRADLGMRPHPDYERRRLAASPWLARKAVLRAWRARGPYDVIDAAGAEGFLLGLLRRFSPYRRARLIVRSHGLECILFQGAIADHHAGIRPRPWYRRFGYPVYRLLQEAGAYRLADAAVVINPGEAAVVARRRWKKPPAIHTVPHGVKQPRFQEAPEPAAPRGGGILFSGTWFPCKGTHYLAQAYELLLARGCDAPLTLLSAMETEPEYQAEEEAEIRAAFAPECQASLRVWTRTWERDEVFEVYRKFDFLVVPSTVEGFGLVVLEALSQRLPVLCTAAVGASAWLTDGVDALIVPPRDPAALAAAMARLWTDSELRARLAEAGYRTAQRFTWIRAAEATLAAYRGEPAQSRDSVAAAAGASA